MARPAHEIQSEVQRLAFQLAQKRVAFLKEERAIVDRLEAIDQEVAEVQAIEATKTPEALRAELDELRATIEAMASEKAKTNP